MSSTEFDIGWLFETKALEIAPANKPFWYTSGLIGPYYVNTHYLCGGEAKAKDLLALIDAEAEDRLKFSRKLNAFLTDVASSSPTYNRVISALTELVRAHVPGLQYISGGQRRDWFFAPLVAKRLGKPCLYIYNDGSIVDYLGQPVTDLKGAEVANVADLLTVGSSYTTKWIPALQKVNGSLAYSFNVVDRSQGGKESLLQAGVKACHSSCVINSAFFNQALRLGYINSDQHQILEAYLVDPYTAMRNFLIANPAFLESALKSSDDKTKGRALILTSQNLYRLES